jgi:TPR repeat protein
MLRNQKVYRFPLFSTLALGLAFPALAQDEASPAVGAAEIAAPDIGSSDIGSPDVGAADIGSSLVEATTDTGTGSADVTPMADATATCDQLAADPVDAQKLSSAEGVTEVSADAVAACLSAVEKSPETARLNYQAGRALRAAGDAVRAFYYFDRAQSLGSLRALVQVADAYMLGAGVTKDEGKAVDLYKQAATQGDAEAAIRIGKYYSEGPAKNLDIAVQWLAGAKTAEGYLALGDLYRDGYKNDQIAFAYYKKAAELGNLEASYSVGTALLRGKGVPRDAEEGLRSLLTIADKSGAAAFAVSDSYKNGLGGSKDGELEVKWLRRAAELGSYEAYERLGNYYFFGYRAGNIEDDALQSLNSFKEAAVRGSERASLIVGNVYLGQHDEKFTKITNINREESRKWLRLRLKLNVEDAYHQLGLSYYSDTPPKFKEMIEEFEKGRAVGEIKSIKWLAAAYAYGWGVSKDVDSALALYEEAFAKGEKYIFRDPAYRFLNGDGFEEDFDAAMVWFKRAADAGDGRSMNEIGNFYWNGIDVEKDFKEAGRWWEMAASHGHVYANLNLAILFSRGLGCSQDMKLAVQLAEIAIRGDREARDALKKGWSNWHPDFLKEFQSRLKEVGKYSGPLDGKFGTGTLAAIDALHDLKND